MGDLDRVATLIHSRLDAGADHVALHVVGSASEPDVVDTLASLPLSDPREVVTLLSSFAGRAAPSASRPPG